MLNGKTPTTGGDNLDTIAEACSNNERKAMKAERATLDLERTIVASRHIGDVFDATISGVQGFGLFCSLDDPYIDGMVPVQSLPSDYYQLDEFGAMLVGQSSGRKYMVGNRVKVEIVNANISRRKVDLRLVVQDAPKGKRKEYAGRDKPKSKPKRGRSRRRR